MSHTLQPTSSMTTGQSLSMLVVLIAMSVSVIAVTGERTTKNTLAQKIQHGTVQAVLFKGDCQWETTDFYHDVDPIDSTPRLYLPTGVSVTIQSSSMDAVYLSRQTSLDIELLAIPELDFSTTFVVKKPGTYELELSPSCGKLWNHKGVFAKIIGVEGRQ